MALSKKVSKWVDEGLLTDDQGLSIIAFEKGRKAGRFSKGLFGLGALAILIGVLAIVAANWQAISPSTKITVHIILNALLAFGIFVYDKQGKETKRELCVTGLMGLTLTFIALVGQIFHLEGSFGQAVILWMVLSTPFVITFGETRISLLPWLLGFITAIFYTLTEYIYPAFGGDIGYVVGMASIVLIPIGFVYLSGVIGALNKPVLEKLLHTSGVLACVIVTSLFCHLWYGLGREPVESISVQLPVILVFVAAVCVVIFMKVPESEEISIDTKALQQILIAGCVIGVLPFVFPHGDSNLIGALSFIVYWLVIGYAGQTSGAHSLVTAAILIIAIRIYVVYLELFGTLLVTGFGLIFSGLVLMGMAWGARKLIKEIDVKPRVEVSHD